MCSMSLFPISRHRAAAPLAEHRIDGRTRQSPHPRRQLGDFRHRGSTPKGKTASPSQPVLFPAHLGWFRARPDYRTRLKTLCNRSEGRSRRQWQRGANSRTGIFRYKSERRLDISPHSEALVSTLKTSEAIAGSQFSYALSERRKHRQPSRTNC